MKRVINGKAYDTEKAECIAHMPEMTIETKTLSQEPCGCRWVERWAHIPPLKKRLHALVPPGHIAYGWRYESPGYTVPGGKEFDPCLEHAEAGSAH